MRSYCAESAGGIARSTASGSGAFSEGWREQAARTHAKPRTRVVRTYWEITGRRLPRHRGNIGLGRPDQCNDPANYAPPEEKIQQKDRQRIALAAQQSNDRRQKIHAKQEGHVHTSIHS